MSEYQCYEFVALDRPLTSKQMAALRAISTRAEISPTRFWNEYEWGDLKADPAKLVERYFDAHLYFANWGTHRLMLRAPIARVDAKRLRAYFVSDAATARIAGKHLILDLHSEDEEADDDEETDGSLAALAPLRAELMRGDPHARPRVRDRPKRRVRRVGAVMTSSKRRPKARARTRGGLSAARVAEMIEEATVDAYGECEQATGWFTVIGDNLDIPFETKVLGVTVTVKRLELRNDNSIAAVCARGADRQTIGLVDLPLPSPKPEGAEWIEAYRRWRGVHDGP